MAKFASPWQEPQAARDGLDDPALAATAGKVVQLGAGVLGHLDLSETQRRQVLDDLAICLATVRPGRRRLA